MILSRVHITNYKQYGGSHDIDLPEVATIGVIGSNGVGKTTLFEAIEWALYSPSSIKSNDVKPRVWRGKTEVRVTLDDPANGVQYTVERELGTGSAKARIYRTDANGLEEKIVDGAPQVTSYVAEKLIGLDHAAFVATFFTRQKELGFFNGSPTTRRRDVGKLLGLETIRSAQQIIAEDRKQAQATAKSYRTLSEESAKDRDFPAEIAAAEKGIADNRQLLETAVAEVTAADAAVEAASTALRAIEHLHDQDGALAQQIAQRQRDHDVAQQQSAHATSELDRLAQAEAERDRLVPVAATLTALQQQDAAHADKRKSALRKREIERDLAAMAQRDGDAVASARAAITGAPAPDGHSSWHVDTPDVAISWARGIDLRWLEQHATSMSAALDTCGHLEKETVTLGRYDARVNELLATRTALVERGDPVERLREIDDDIARLNASSAAADSTLQRTAKDLQKSERVLANLRGQHEGETCPTCQRPFTAEDTAHAIQVFQREIEQHQRLMQEVQQQKAANARTIRAKQDERVGIADAVKQLTDTNAALETSKSYMRDQRAKVDDLTARLQHLLSVLQRNQAPTAHECEAVQKDLIAWRKVVDAARTVHDSQETRAKIASERAPLTAELETLAGVTYDEAAHRVVTEKLQEARQAQSTIDRITTELAKRDQILLDRSTAEETVAAAVVDLGNLHRQRSDLGFDPAALQSAREARDEAEQRKHVATEQRHRADGNLREAEHALKTVQAEQKRIEKLVLDAEAKQREADDLDLMYKEFTEFERYAAAWYAPKLSEITSDLVSQVTDGKYDRVEFDNNFSIQVYDGSDEKFPYETFSGGERDAIALCARIALSRVIGGASTTPPGFLVLDEVFGSLDLARRQRMLEMLGAITGADDHFRQVFLISHVDDVRYSPVLDDIWRVIETDAGTSELQMLGVGTEIGEL